MEYWSTLILSFLTGAFGIHYFILRRMDKLEEMGILHIKPLPVLGNMADVLFGQRPIVEVLNNVYKLNEEASYVGFYDFGEPVILVRSPELIKNVAIKNFDYFMDHRGFLDAAQDYLFAKNLFTLRGDKWREVRALMSPAFTGSKMKSMFKLMSNCGRSFAEFLAERSVAEPSTVSTKDAFTRFTNDVIATCAFGVSVDSMRNPKNDFYTFGRKATDFDGILGVKFFLLRSFPRMSRFFNVKMIDSTIVNFFEGILRDTMTMRDKEGVTRPDMIQLLMEARGKKIGDGPEFTIQDMTAQAFVFFFGGFDTTSSLMCFTAYSIAVNPDTQRRLQKEVDKVMEETNGEPTYDAIMGMRYLDAVINETLRMFPVASFHDRVCVKKFELPPAFPGAKPVIVEPGQNLWFPVYSLHRDPKYFTNPDEFDPGRFMGSRKNEVAPFTYFPFGQGPRICIGFRFALLETKVVIFHLLSKCHLKPSPKTLVPLELSKSIFSMTAKGGFWLQFESRETLQEKESRSYNDTSVESNGFAKVN